MRFCPKGLNIMLPKPDPAIAMPMTSPLFLMNQLFMSMDTVEVLTVARPAPMTNPQIQNCQASRHCDSAANERIITAAPVMVNSFGLIFL